MKSSRAFFAQRPIGPGELPSIMKKHIATGTMGSAWGNVISGIIYIYFGNAVGLTRLQWGILGGIGSWVVIMQPLGTLLAQRVGSRRMVWFWTAFADRALRMVGIIVALLLELDGRPEAAMMFILGICAGTLIGNLSPGPWYGWLCTIIPREVQGSFWGRRDSWISLVVTLVALPTGLVMDLVPRDAKLLTSAAILVGASIVGLADILIHRTIPEPPLAPSPRASMKAIISPLRDKSFRPWLIFTACWNVSQSLGGTLATLYFMDNLGFKNNLLGGIISVTVVGLLGTMLVARSMGRMVDRFGVKKVLIVSHLLWSTVPVYWLFAEPGASALVWVGIAGVIGAVFSTAATNASVKLATRFPGREEGDMYMAVSTMMANVASGLGALAAGVFLDVMGAWTATVFGLVVSAFPVLFVVSFGMRMATVFGLLPRVRATPRAPKEERLFLLPLFFETLPAIRSVVRREPVGSPPGRKRRSRR